MVHLTALNPCFLILFCFVVLVMIHLFALDPYPPVFFSYVSLSYLFIFGFLFAWKWVIQFFNYIKHLLMTNNLFILDIIMY